MSRRIRVPEAAEFRQRWQRLDRAGRRRVRRAVNRGRVCERREEAALAVVVGRQQKTAWLVTWPIVAVLVGLTSIPQGLASVAATAGLAALVYAPFALFFFRRAKRAVEHNLAAVERRDTKKTR
jgi:hypothetical protein